MLRMGTRYKSGSVFINILENHELAMLPARIRR